MPPVPAHDVAYLRGVPIFVGLTDAQLAALAPSLHHRAFPARTVVFHQGEPGHALFIIIQGKVRVYLTSAAGQELTADILSAGEVFGEMALLGEHPRSASVATLTDTHMLQLARADFHRYIRAYPEIALSILAVLADRLRATTAFAAELVFNDLHGRLARALLTLAARHGVRRDSAIYLDVALTQADVAGLVGSTRESVNRVLGVFRDHGLVTVEGTRITVLRADELERIIARGGVEGQSVTQITPGL
jgi:CRP/FNR family transcriptional regulator, cyclic AMP receptor protein